MGYDDNADLTHRQFWNENGAAKLYNDVIGQVETNGIVFIDNGRIGKVEIVLPSGKIKDRTRKLMKLRDLVEVALRELEIKRENFKE